MSTFITRLANRSLVRIYGPDCCIYLQGLLSNDVRRLYQPRPLEEIDALDVATDPEHVHMQEIPGQPFNSMGTFMLNASGRIICDLIVYRTPATRDLFTGRSHDELLIECDSEQASSLARLLFAYRVKRAISVSLCNELSVWSLFKTDPPVHKIEDLDASQVIEIVSPTLTLVQDPRLFPQLGYRIISTASEYSTLMKQVNNVLGLKTQVLETNVNSYIRHRYALGVGEGAKDHPEHTSLPLESNADYLNMVSFNKGCYLGQELTSRIHHTGVVRKRLLPVTINWTDKKPADCKPLYADSEIVSTEDDKVVGKLRNWIGDRGLALMRIEACYKFDRFRHQNSGLEVTAKFPQWWPPDLKYV